MSSRNDNTHDFLIKQGRRADSTSSAKILDSGTNSGLGFGLFIVRHSQHLSSGHKPGIRHDILRGYAKNILRGT
jgi:hypothetical protein